MITQVNSGVLNVHKAHMNNNTKKEAKNTSQKQNSDLDYYQVVDFTSGACSFCFASRFGGAVFPLNYRCFILFI